MTNKELFMFSNRNKGGGTPQPSPPDVPYSDWVTLAELPSGTTNIPSNAFNGFSNLRNIEINNGLTSIGSYAFYDCTALKEVDVPRTVTEIGEQALGYGTNGKIAEFTILCDYETAAEEYAVTNNVPFEHYGTYTYSVDANGYISLLSYENTSGNTEIFVPANLEGHVVRRAQHGMFGGLTVTRITFKHGFAGFVTTYNDWGGLPSSLEYLHLPNTYIFAEHPDYILKFCTKLEEIELEQGFNYALICNKCPLTQQSLVGMLNALADLTGEQAKTLTVGNANLAKLTNEQIAIATEKNWTLA